MHRLFELALDALKEHPHELVHVLLLVDRGPVEGGSQVSGRHRVLRAAQLAEKLHEGLGHNGRRCVGAHSGAPTTSSSSFRSSRSIRSCNHRSNRRSTRPGSIRSSAAPGCGAGRAELTDARAEAVRHEEDLHGRV